MTSTMARDAPEAIQRPVAVPGLGGMARFNKERLAFLQEAARRGGDVATHRLGPVRTIQLNAPHLFHAVLVERGDDFGKTFLVLRALRVTVGDSLLTLEDDEHRRHRRIMAPVLTPRRVEAYAGTMVAYADRARRGWAEGATVDLVAMSTALAMSIAGKTLFGADVFDETDALGAAVANNIAYVDHLTSH